MSAGMDFNVRGAAFMAISDGAAELWLAAGEKVSRLPGWNMTGHVCVWFDMGNSWVEPLNAEIATKPVELFGTVAASVTRN